MARVSSNSDRTLSTPASFRAASWTESRSTAAEVSDDYLRLSPQFLPLTESYILHNGEPPFEHVVSVVIVNTAHVTQIHPLVTLA